MGGAEAEETTVRFGLYGLAIASVVCAQTGHAQLWERLGNPTVAIEVEHPPGLGLMVDRVVFGPVRGDCANALVDNLVGRLASSGLPVANRAARYARPGRYERDFGDRIDRAVSVEMERWSGGAVVMMAALDVNRCAVETEFSEGQEKTTVTREDGRKEEVTEKTYRLEAQAFLEWSLWTIDLTTGRILDDRSLAHSSPEREFSSKEGYPHEPAALELLDEELEEAAEQIRRMFVPWTEEVDVVFYDDRDCGLRDAHRVLRRGDLGQTLALSERNLASCERTPNVEAKLLARAHYNVGIAHLLRRDYDAALAALHTAGQLRPSAIMREGIATARKAKELAASMADFDRQTPFRAGRPRGVDVRPRDEEPMRNADVVRMAKEGVPTSIILSMIDSSSREFDTSTPAIIALVGEGVDEEIIKAMLTAD